MEEYFEAKQLLFTDLLWDSVKPHPVAVVNLDDEWGRRLRVAQKANLVTFAKVNSKGDSGAEPAQAEADWLYQITKADFSVTEFRVVTRRIEIIVRLPMVGDHQVSNAVAVLASVHALNERHQPGALDLRRLAHMLEDFPGVPGRLEKVHNKRGFHVFVDYAHSPDALDNVLKSLRQIQRAGSLPSRIITVFGCGGDRDQGKRPLMAQIAEKWSDQVIITSDNPRSEEPEKILTDIAKGFSAGFHSRYESVVDRRMAIEKAFQTAQRDDVILIAGKGHEDYQEIAGKRLTFRDQDVVKEILG
jgi:UDP-N-acetylmuramoyl-L-alanyl-D-glutamate--2,6-diaminopimelate ligase